MFRGSLAVAAIVVGVSRMVAAQPVTPRDVAPLRVPAATLAQALGLPDPDPSTLMLRAIRLIYGGDDGQARRGREAVAAAFDGTQQSGGGTRKPDNGMPGKDVVPLPLDGATWERVLLQTPPGERGLVQAILDDRRASLLYVGMAALDDGTLAWLQGNPETLLHLRKNPGVFAAFGRSLRVHEEGISVPGGREVEALWAAVIGADPASPAAFVQRLIDGDGRLAFLYDTIAHLDPPRQRFALGLQTRSSSREDGLRALLASFTAAAPDWRVEERPFARPPIDGAMLLSTVRVSPQGMLGPPAAPALWERIFRGDGLSDVRFERVDAAAVGELPAYLTADAAWLASRILRIPYALGRRRLDTLLFGQRVFGDRPSSDAAAIATALRGYLAFPALMIALERSGVSNPLVFAQSAEHAARLNRIESLPLRTSALAKFQSVIAVIERTRRNGVLTGARAERLLVSLSELEVSSHSGYEWRFSSWLRDQLLPSLPARPTAESTMLNALAGPAPSPDARVVEWEGRSYRVDPASAELKRLEHVRERQGGLTLDAALSGASGGEPGGQRLLAEALLSIVYALHLGDPEGAAVTSGNVALRHDFGVAATSADNGRADPWRLPIEYFGGKTAWRVRGSILGLEAALARLSLRRLDSTAMPAEPSIGPQDRQTLMLTAALLNPFEMTDAARDTIAGAIARGRARVAALPTTPSEVEAVAHAAGLSEWRRQALRWLLARGDDVLSRFSLLELLWVGMAREGAVSSLDAWGAAQLPLTGCLCLEMPASGPWEDLGGRQAAVMATRGADVTLRVAETLAALQLPASLAAGLAGYVTQDVIERARLGYPDDWQEFGQAARDLPRERMFDYIAALTVGGALVPE